MLRAGLLLLMVATLGACCSVPTSEEAQILTGAAYTLVPAPVHYDKAVQDYLRGQALIDQGIVDMYQGDLEGGQRKVIEGEELIFNAEQHYQDLKNSI